MPLTAAIDTPQLGTIGVPAFPVPFPIDDAQVILYAGCMAATNATGKIVEASNTASIVVRGRVEETVDNTATGKTCVVRPGIYRYANDDGRPCRKTDIGKYAYVLDAATATAEPGSCPAGVIYDVDDDGVWLDQSVAAQALIMSGDAVPVAVPTPTPSPTPSA